MCKFFSCVSDGKGNLKYFDVKDIVEQMSIGNPKTYNWNSHTSICQFHGINSMSEDLWNKWEYDPKTQNLSVDTRPIGTADDSEIIKPLLVKYFKGKNVDFMVNLYGNNSGYRNSGSGNSGYRNSGSGNSGNRNSGDRNSGNWNSGNWNSGDRNSGNWNSGDRNSGNWNSGNWNSGNCNSGDRNSGDRNSGNWNSGDRNSGNWNSGNWNSGNCNSGNGVLNSFCTEQKYMLFDKPCSEKEYEKLNSLPWSWFELTKWINDYEMTDEEKRDNKYWDVSGGYLKTIEYKEAWKKCPKEFIDQVKKLKNFNKKKFEKITGLKVWK